MSQRVIYTRIPLEVKVIFAPNGQMTPVSLFFGDKQYTIDRILRVRPYKPPKIAAIAPIAYTVVIEGIEKEIYFEAESNTWFSVKAQYL